MFGFNNPSVPWILASLTEKIIALYPWEEQKIKEEEFFEIERMDPNSHAYWRRLKKLLTELYEMVLEEGLYKDKFRWEEVFLFRLAVIYVEDKEKEMQALTTHLVFENCHRLN